MDMIMAMNMGGDDFIQKPFDTELLVAKIRALLRRSYSYTETQANLLEHDGIVLNLNDLNIYYDDKKMELTKTEFVIMHLLMKNAGSIVNRNKIMRILWKHEQFIDNNTLSVHITRLRKKLSELGIENFILTKRRRVLHKMNFLKYIKDKRYFLYFYTLIMLFISSVLLLSTESQKAWNNVVYINISCLFFAILYIVIGYFTA